MHFPLPFHKKKISNRPPKTLEASQKITKKKKVKSVSTPPFKKLNDRIPWYYSYVSDFTYHTDFPKKILQKSYSFGWALTPPPPKVDIKNMFFGGSRPSGTTFIRPKKKWPFSFQNKIFSRSHTIVVYSFHYVPWNTLRSLIKWISCWFLE